MAIQVSHFYAQWIATEVDRPLCQLIFIEEPEVHLHAQVQQVFISNIYKILSETAEETGEAYIPPQLVISTHSSHVVDTVDFEKVRYFRRCPLMLEEGDPDAPLVASKILNLKNFQADPDPYIELANAEGLTSDEQAALKKEIEYKSRQANLNFLKKYMKLTHCDLFFADAVVLVEGTVEKILMGQMIQLSASQLENCYITVLEVGGAYAHKFSSLMKFLGIPFVVITDIDTVDATDARKACPACQLGSKTSNAALKFFLGTKERDELVRLDRQRQIVENNQGFVTFQRPVTVKLNGISNELHGRTLEETFVYENISFFRDTKPSVGYEFAQGMDLDTISEETYKTIVSKTFKKTEFALGVVAETGWDTPRYIADGLHWLVEKLKPTPIAVKSEQCGETVETIN
jgi:hypothetical protein